MANAPNASKQLAAPDSRLGRWITEFIRDTEPTLLFHHSSRVHHFGALAGRRRGLVFDPERLYAGAMFHDAGLVPAPSSSLLFQALANRGVAASKFGETPCIIDFHPRRGLTCSICLKQFIAILNNSPVERDLSLVILEAYE